MPCQAALASEYYHGGLSYLGVQQRLGTARLSKVGLQWQQSNPWLRSSPFQITSWVITPVLWPLRDLSLLVSQHPGGSAPSVLEEGDLPSTHLPST